jgi:hypothetical protein
MKRSFFAFAVALLAAAMAISCADPPVDTGDDFTFVSKGKSYTINFTPNASYQDAVPLRLTDGLWPFGTTEDATDGSANMVSLTAPNDAATNPTIIVDLGTDLTAISFFGVKTWNDVNGWGVTPPSSLTISVSDDNSVWTTVKTGANTVYGDLIDGTLVTMGYKPAATVSGRYVKFEIVIAQNVIDGGYMWTMINEVLVGTGTVPADVQTVQ